MAVIVEQAHRLERLTSNLLVYARPAELNLQDFSLKDLCREVKGLVPADKKEISLELECSSKTVNTDREKLIQIVLNLIQNSMEAMEKQEGEKRVIVNLEATDEGLYIRVSDTGPGFPEGLQGDIFEPFVTTKTRGTGLGLAIVKRLVLAMNGRIEAGNRPQGGAAVEIYLPFPERD
jgi:two-component system sensor histidine kinase HydH